jgi:hypothetical protein
MELGMKRVRGVIQNFLREQAPDAPPEEADREGDEHDHVDPLVIKLGAIHLSDGDVQGQLTIEELAVTSDPAAVVNTTGGVIVRDEHALYKQVWVSGTLDVDAVLMLF